MAIGAACVSGFAFELAALAAVTVAVVVLRARGSVTTVWGVVVFCSALAGYARSVPAPETTSQPWFDGARAVRGVVVSGPLSTERGQRFSLSVHEFRGNSGWHRVDAVICVYAAEVPEIRRGDRVRQAVAIERLADLPEGVADALAARGCSARATAWTTTVTERGRGWQHTLDGLRRTMAGRLQAAAPGDKGALMAGLVTGDDGALSDGARSAFIATGTTHITAVSGSNIAIVLVSAIALGGRLGVHRRLVWHVATSAGVWGYALLVGLEPPAFRAAIVATGVVFAARFGRRADLVTLTTLAAALQLLWRPSDYWTLSFRLSFVSALALALVLRGMGSAGFWGTVRVAFVATASAQIATMPVLISSFGQVTPLSLPANFLIAPFVGIAFPLAFLGSLVGFVSESLGDAVAMPGSLAAEAILRVVRAMGTSDGAQVAVSQPGTLTNAIVVAGCASAVALLSLDCRRAIQRTWRWGRAGPSRTAILGTLGCLGFAIGLIVGAAR